MMRIIDLRRIRQDGKVIDENMGVDEMLAAGWEPCIITCVRWYCGSRLVEHRHQFGMLAELIPDRSAVAVLKGASEDAPLTDLSIINSDGTKRLSIPNTQTIRGVTMAGTFGWFEKPHTQSPTVFGVVFHSNSSRMFQLDIDATTGEVLRVSEAR